MSFCPFINKLISLNLFSGDKGEHCVGLPPAPNDCCPSEYKCEEMDAKKKLEKLGKVRLG
jgi:hypothetical protein